MSAKTDKSAQPVSPGADKPAKSDEAAKTPKSSKTPKPPKKPRPPRRPFSFRRSFPVGLYRTAHARQALLIAGALAGAAAMAGRPAREVGLVFVTVLVGQVILGWHNDVVDAKRDAAHHRPDKPIAVGHIAAESVTFAIACAILLVIPLSIANGVIAGSSHLILLAIAMAANWGLLRRTRFSYLPWMATFALFPAFLSYGGWGGVGAGGPPTIEVTLLSALLGIGVHLLTSLPGLVDDNTDGIRHFPLRLALRTGAPRLLMISAAYTALVGGGLLVAGMMVGLVQ